MAITAQSTYDIFIGSGALTHPWYQEISDNKPDEGTDEWSVTFTEFGDNREPVGRHTITHKDVMRAVRKISSKDGADLINPEVRKQCRALVFKGPDAVDFDSGMADAVLQVAVFGEVAYG